MAKSKRDGKKEGIGETIRTVIWAVLIAVVFRSLLFQPFWIPSGSMKSTLLIGDYLFISKYSYGYSRYSFPFGILPFGGRIMGSEPERGDVVVFRNPHNGEDYIKRLTGLPGDQIQMKDGVLWINGEPSKMDSAGFFTEPFKRGHTRCLDTEQKDGEVQCIKEMWRETFPDGHSHYVLNADSRFNQGTDNTAVFTVPEGEYFFMGDNRDNSNDSRQGVGFVPYDNLLGRAEIIAISSDGPFWEIWNWRWSRFLTVIR